MSIITLLTDFGTHDEYVGVVKGVILGIHPTVTLVDITHEIEPQGVAQAADVLKAAFHWFPKGTIHLAVVDPGVGSARAIVAAQYAGHTFLAPDNGLLSLLWEEDLPQTLVRVENSVFFRHPVSNTFHGRDIFAPVAAHLSLGIAIDALGPPMAPTQLVSIRSSMAQWNAVTDEITGEITGADRFGNLRTNIDAALVDLFAQKHGGESLVVQVGGQRIEGICATYSARANGQIMALMGSRNRLEIAVRGGNAAQMFESPKDLRVKITAVHTVETMKGK